ncbi:MAG: YaaR family protein [Bacilli bacterium]
MLKIDHGARPALTASRSELRFPVTNTQSFQAAVARQEQKLQFEQLQRLFKEVDVQSGRVVKSRNFKDLARYRSLVKRFVKEAVDFGMDLKQSHSWTPEGYSQMLTIVARVDATLCELTDEMLQDADGNIALLEKIGEIKGLLINIFA